MGSLPDTIGQPLRKIGAYSYNFVYCMLYEVITSAKKSTETPSIGTSQFDDDTILEKAKLARNGIEFQKLWGGDFSSYPSQSEADLALCGILAFWCNRDIAQIDRLFRRSGLMRVITSYSIHYTKLYDIQTIDSLIRIFKL